MQVSNKITKQNIQILNTNYLSSHLFIAFVEIKSGFRCRKKNLFPVSVMECFFTNLPHESSEFSFLIGGRGNRLTHVVPLQQKHYLLKLLMSTETTTKL